MSRAMVGDTQQLESFLDDPKAAQRRGVVAIGTACSSNPLGDERLT
jgi:hypothetical protein